MPNIGKLIDRSLNRLPPRWASWLDRMNPDAWIGWGGPMNGQAARQQLVRDLFGAISFDNVLETGTYRGATTEFLAHVSGRPVYSVEAMERFARFAQFRCTGLPNVHIAVGDSRPWLQQRAGELGHTRSFIYLDAHWQDDVPRHEELRIIHAHWHQAVVMIDDFQVPDESGYGFAHYGGVPLTTAYLPPLPGWVGYYPSTPAASETGARRGSLVLAPATLSPLLDKLSLLRRAELHPAPTGAGA